MEKDDDRARTESGEDRWSERAMDTAGATSGGDRWRDEQREPLERRAVRQPVGSAKKSGGPTAGKRAKAAWKKWSGALTAA